MIELLLAASMASQNQVMNLACMHGEDYVFSTHGFERIDEYLGHKTQQLSPNDEMFRAQLHDNGINCARAMARELGVDIPQQYVP